MRRTALFISTLCAGLVPAVAEAHLVATGMGPLYDGISHYGLSPEDFLPIIALAFFAGLRGPALSRKMLGALTLGWLAGGAVSLSGAMFPPTSLPMATAVLFLLTGGLLSANVEVPMLAGVGTAFALGVVRAVYDVSGVYASPGHILTLIGMTAAAFATFALAASLTLPLQRMWMVVAVRVGGSWIAALGLLLAGWIFRYGAAIS
jgi:hypothetical protein